MRLDGFCFGFCLLWFSFLDFFVVGMQFGNYGFDVIFVDGVQGVVGNMQFDLVVFVGDLEVMFMQIG